MKIKLLGYSIIIEKSSQIYHYTNGAKSIDIISNLAAGDGGSGIDRILKEADVNKKINFKFQPGVTIITKF